MISKIQTVKKEVSKVVVGQEKMIDGLLIALLCEGHILIEGVPGLAKTTTVNALAKALGLNFKRAQFTPDLLPSDILGAEIYDPQNNSFKIKKGPIFTNLLLADEINRAPAKVQSALLEVMQEQQVTLGDATFQLDSPFFVMATQNPVEQEGVYQLPEAQLDRFMLKIIVDYNTKEEELEIARRISSGSFESIEAVLTHDDLIELKRKVKEVHIDSEVEEYMIELVNATRNPSQYGLEELKDFIQFGASPRVSIDMFKAVKAMAFLRGKDFVTPVDIAYVAKELMRHRIVLTYEAEAEGITTDEIIQKVLETVQIP
ncbi:MAG: ATPase [Sulfurimonas sp. CG08_land_8_20_14_0_20_36_33]|nr:MAG: ATPase [Helicobacteraceae bacterium CG1_02_36_14]PIS24072.1 MAG: ATPase [Sulfurimonas sp. CG08_land_8_20_14_0_20_36_33]PIU35556.1 MAG: ATPase [Sulfurimonas sp. CG07_land_8_20_14_0_80_36_56]PIV05477.1 MAG: ATPase [Sulfurimonas sp. CG03_land_8_20_14_0_80_36_25]PIV37119.1 MAG: ATPase [Sulfurimonas sp. CG02_land_8_20_14_3_00_36_67]PIV61039.1 MAG: ATPase [Sulfurimonas sp. CG01_land_8_20_14_3_00_36_23]PIW25378.1 MAG: ATPase [Sulfurimonas sp. CG15_BIG_FIL_POST_REV_8_21_14_020_36_339]PIW5227